MRLAPPPADHPATSLLSDTRRLDIDRVQIYRRHRFDVDPGNSIAVLLRAEGGEPVAIERDLGRGKVIVMSIPLGVAWSNLPLLHSYVVLAREWLWYLTESGIVKHNLVAGEPLQVAEPMETASASARLETPSGRVVQLFGEEENRRPLFRYAKTQAPGAYRLTISDSGQGALGTVFGQPEPEEIESDAVETRRGNIENLYLTVEEWFSEATRFQPPSHEVAPPPKALASWLLMALLALMARLKSPWLSGWRAGGGQPRRLWSWNLDFAHDAHGFHLRSHKGTPRRAALG